MFLCLSVVDEAEVGQEFVDFPFVEMMVVVVVVEWTIDDMKR